MRRLFLSIFLLVPLVAIGQDVFRSVDEAGNVVYSDVPRDGLSERVVIRTVRAEPRPPAPSANPAAGNQRAAGDPAANAPVNAEIPREATPDEIAEDRRRNCEFAQQRNEAYSTARRLFRSLPNGEREYLTDEELEEARNKAQSDVATWCD